jgi:hypothetical protein
MSPAEQLAVPVNVPEADFREVPGNEGALSLLFDKACLRGLEHLVRDGIKAIPRQGLEIGGLVIGRMLIPDDPVVTVLEFFPVDIEYRFGPRFVLSEQDDEVLAELLSKWSDCSDRRVIGFFRSHLTAAKSLRNDDQRLVERFFHDDSCCLLVVHASMSEESQLHFYAREPGEDLQIINSFPVVEIPQARPLRRERPVIETPKYEVVTDLQPPATPPQQNETPQQEEIVDQNGIPPQIDAESSGVFSGESIAMIAPDADAAGSFVFRSAPQEKSAASYLRLWIVASALIVVLVMVLGFVIASRMRAKPAPIGLSVQMRGSRVLLKWNTANAAVRNAVRGSLVIVDSARGDRIELNAEQVRAGAYEYTPAQTDLTFNMMLYQNDATFAGETRSFHLNIPAPPIQAVSLGSKTPPNNGRPLARPRDGAGANIPRENQRRPFTLAATSPATAPEPKVDTPPELQVSAAAIPAAIINLAVAPPAVDPPAVNPQPVNAAPVNAPVNVNPPVNIAKNPVTERETAKPVTFSTAVPVKRFSPAIPLSLRSSIRNEVTVRIKVAVDQTGKVTGADPTETKDGFEKLLAPLAIQAVKLWQFEPARRNGAPVASETVVVFHFSR